MHAVFLPCLNCTRPLPEGLIEKLYDLRRLDHTRYVFNAPHLLLFVICGLYFLALQSFRFSELQYS